MKVFIKKNKEVYSIDKYKEITESEIVIFDMHFNIKDVEIKKLYMGAFNLGFKVCFYKIIKNNKTIFYHKETDNLFFNELDVTKFYEGLLNMYINKIRVLKRS